jgi:hypothetical protein
MADEEPLTISVTLGATIPTGDYGNLKPSVEIRGIRLDQPIEPQLELALAATAKAWLAIDGEIEVKVTEMLSQDAGGQAGDGVRERLKKLEEFKGTAVESIKNIAEEVRKHKKALEAPKPKRARKPKVQPMGPVEMPAPVKRTKKPEPLGDKIGYPYPESPT